MLASPGTLFLSASQNTSCRRRVRVVAGGAAAKSGR